jgi:hypothetical protein
MIKLNSRHISKKRKLTFELETIAELTNTQLHQVVGASDISACTTSCDTCTMK